MHRLRGNDDEQEDARSRKKQRKQRQCYSCEECRRLKMKCDRQVPCSNCVRRNKTAICNGAPARDAYLRQSSDSSAAPLQDVERGQRSSHVAGYDQNPASAFPAHVQQGMEESEVPRSRDTHRRPGNSQEIPTVPLPGRTPESFNNIATEARDFGANGLQPSNISGPSDSHGTLMLSMSGRSKYLGPTAGSEWLKDSETQDVPESPTGSGTSSPSDSQAHSHPPNHSGSNTAPITFPFNAALAKISTRDLLSRLAPKDEAWTLAESYYRYCAWHHDVAPKVEFQKTFDRVYERFENGTSSAIVDPQEVALVFIIMAQGTLYNIEMPNNDSSAEEWLHLAERALVKGEFLSNNTIAGLQTLHLMAHLHLQLDKGHRGDNAWPLWGLVMRLIQAMGMHRDGVRWNLPRDVLETRRKVFWECNAADIFQAHCFSRPCAINPEHCDTAFPSEASGAGEDKTYSTLRFELSQLSSKILNMAMKVQRPAYEDVTALDLKLCEFECSLPRYIRCRAAFLAMPSRYPNFEAAIEASPEPSRRSMTISFQQMNLALNISETIINLHRPWYAKVLYDDIDIRVEPEYGSSFLTVIERCAMIIAIVGDIHGRFPAVSTRQWNFWYHVFGSALCLGTLVLRDPGNAMANFVLVQIDAAIDLFYSIIQHGAKTPRYNRNLRWLLKLRSRLSSKMATASGVQISNATRTTSPNQPSTAENREDGEDIELLGWRTRLIERVGQDIHTNRTVHSATASTNFQSTSVSQPTLDGSETTPRMSIPMVTPNSTDELLHDFWDPMLLQDVFQTPNDETDDVIGNSSTWWADNTMPQVTPSWRCG